MDLSQASHGVVVSERGQAWQRFIAAMRGAHVEAMVENAPIILVIDDSLLNHRLLAAQLVAHDYHILQARDGVSGIELARQHRPDLILLDVLMEGMDGFEVCARLKQDSATSLIPVIMITALADVQHRIQGLNVGADDVLTRPYDERELLVRVRNLIQLTETRTRLRHEHDKLQLLYNVVQATMRELNTEQMLGAIVKSTPLAVGASKGSIMLVNSVGAVTHKLMFREADTLHVADNVNPDVMSHGLAGWIVRHNQPAVVRDAQRDSRWIRLPDDVDAVGSVIGVPLSKGERVLGVLILMHHEIGYFRDDHLELLTAIGGQITAAIENAYLFDEADSQRRKLEAILAYSTEGIITTDEAFHISLLNRASADLFGIDPMAPVGQSINAIPQLGALAALLARAGSRAASGELVAPGGRIIYATVSSVPAVGYIAVMQDITGVKQAEAQRLEQEREEKQRVKDAFSRYMSVALIERILADDPATSRHHERRWAVVLFADLRNFTRMVVNVPAPTAIEVLNSFFENMAQIIHQYEGTIFDLIGDELEIGFNVPLNQPDAAERALRAAIAMQCRFNQLRPVWLEATGIALGLGIGLDAGDVIVGDIGATTRKNFTMVGEAVNVSHRLVDLAEDGHIILSERMFLAVRDELAALPVAVRFVPLGKRQLKGLNGELPLYRGFVEPEWMM